jgi:hypothetical protein
LVATVTPLTTMLYVYQEGQLVPIEAFNVAPVIALVAHENVFTVAVVFALSFPLATAETEQVAGIVVKSNCVPAVHVGAVADCVGVAGVAGGGTVIVNEPGQGDAGAG